MWVCSTAATMCLRPCKWWLKIRLIFRSQHLFIWWPLTFWPWNWCAMSPVARTTFLPICLLCGFSLSSYGPTRVKQTWHYNLDLWPSRSPRMSHSVLVVATPFNFNSRLRVARQTDRQATAVNALFTPHYGGGGIKGYYGNVKKLLTIITKTNGEYSEKWFLRTCHGLRMRLANLSLWCWNIIYRKLLKLISFTPS